MISVVDFYHWQLWASWSHIVWLNFTAPTPPSLNPGPSILLSDWMQAAVRQDCNLSMWIWREWFFIFINVRVKTDTIIIIVIVVIRDEIEAEMIWSACLLVKRNIWKHKILSWWWWWCNRAIHTHTHRCQVQLWWRRKGRSQAKCSSGS